MGGGDSLSAGGERKGAGWPPLSAENRPVAITVKIHPTLAAKWATYCKKRAKSQAVTFAEYVKRLRP